MAGIHTTEDRKASVSTAVFWILINAETPKPKTPGAHTLDLNHLQFEPLDLKLEALTRSPQTLISDAEHQPQSLRSRQISV